MAAFIHEYAARNHWLEEYHDDLFYGTSNLGAFVRRQDGTYLCTAKDSARTAQALELLRPEMALTMSFTAVSIFMGSLEEDEHVAALSSGYMLPVIPSIVDFYKTAADADRAFGACLCKKEHFVLVWGSEPNGLLEGVADLERLIVGQVSVLLHV